MLFLKERCQNIQCIVVCGVCACIAADYLECPCWPLSTAKNTHNAHVSIRTGPRINESGLVCWVTCTLLWKHWHKAIGFRCKTSLRCWPGLWIPQISIQSSICEIHRGPTSQLTGILGSAVNILVPDTTAQFWYFKFTYLPNILQH